MTATKNNTLLPHSNTNSTSTTPTTNKTARQPTQQPIIEDETTTDINQTIGINDSNFFNLDETFNNTLNNTTNSKFNTSYSYHVYGGPSLVSVIEPETLLQSQRIVNNVSDPQSDNSVIDLPPHVCHILTVNRGLTKLYDWQKSCLSQDNVKNFKSLCYQVPTGGGKSLVAEILLLKMLFQRNLNGMVILPYVSLVQEKVAAFSYLGTRLDFFVDEYAAGKGVLPPIKRRRGKRTVYICTIEKANMLVDSLLFADRLDEIGIAVIDEVHMLYETGTRGGTLEALITKLKCKNENCQLVGMSATIPNMGELSKFLSSQSFENLDRPITLTHYVKDGPHLFKAKHSKTGETKFEYANTIQNPANDGLFDLIWETVGDKDLSPEANFINALPPRPGTKRRKLEKLPKNSSNCIVFCSSKKQCEILCQNYAKEYLQKHELVRDLLNQVNQSQDLSLLPKETQSAYELLKHDAYGTLCPILKNCIPVKAAYHHAGLTPDERRTIEEMYNQGQINVLFATSTVAAGVNLGASRVIIRSPKIGINPLDATKYRQMAGRAGRAGKNDSGECILIIPKTERHGILATQRIASDSRLTINLDDKIAQL